MTEQQAPQYAPGPAGPGYGQTPWYPAAPTPTPPPVTQPTPSRAPGRAALIIATSALSAVIGAGAGVGGYVLTAGQVAPGGTITVSTAAAPASPAVDGSIGAAAGVISPSVVTITVQGQQAGDIGTGVIIDTQGHILTNNHVVATTGQSTITVTLDDGRTMPATVVGTAPSTDLAVVKVSDGGSLTPARFATSSSVALGQAVVAVGAPLGLSDTVTSGIVSATARPVRSGNDDNAVYQAVQTDTSINPGNSGGPLVNLNGEVVGINSSIATVSSSSTSQSGNIGIGFAIPADVAVRVAQNLINTGSSPDAALGVKVATGGSLASETTSTGVTLGTVDPGKAAAAAGLQAGDVVTQLGQFRTTTSDGLIAAVRYYAPGTKVDLAYTRGGQSTTVQVTLGTA